MSGTRKRRGTTLVELSLVIAILAMIALPFATFVSQNLKNTVQSSTQLKEQMVLEQVMQDMEKHLRSAVRTPSHMNPIANEIVFYSVDPEAVASNLPKQTQYEYSLADGRLTKYVDTARATFPDGLEAVLITSMTFPEAERNLDPINPPCYITVLLEIGTTAPEKTVLRKTIYLRNYTSTVSIPKILGVTVPRTGEYPATTITPTTQYTGTVAWTPALPVGEKFKNATEYTATITLAPIGDYTLTGVAANFFTVAGASVAVPNAINAGVVTTGEFPMTVATQLTITGTTLTTSKPYDGTTTATVTAVGTLSGVVGGDTVTVSAVATYDTAAVGVGKTITVVYALGGAQAGNYVKPVNYTVTTGVITLAPINIAAIPGVTAPATGAIPVTTITATAQYTGTVAWSGSPVTFAPGRIYIATITLTPTAGYTLTGVAANFFTVAGATTVTNTVNSGVVTATFPATAPVAIGDSYGGGIVAYILQSVDPGYDANVQHGLIAAASDQSTGIYWHARSEATGPTATAIGTGNANTNAIVASYGLESNAARLCYDLSLNGYSDWYLPSQDELGKLYLNKTVIGTFANFNYWSSSESNPAKAWSQDFTNGNQSKPNKDTMGHVRAVRAF